MTGDLTLTLARDQALVLFDMIARLGTDEGAGTLRKAEEMVCWVIEGQLEKVLVEPFAPNYAELLEEARKRVVARKED